MSESVSSYNGSFVQYDEERTTSLYRNIKKSLVEVQAIAAEVNFNYKKLEANMNRATQLILAIETSRTGESDAAATASVTMNQ